MPKPTSTLSNCYLPLPLSSLGTEAGDSGNATVTPRRKRDAGDNNTRPSHGLRRLVLQSSSSSTMNTDDGETADATTSTSSTNKNTGWTYLELGHTKVSCQVLAPLSASSPELPSNIQLGMDQGTLVCQVKYVPQIAYPTGTLLASSVSTAVENSANNNAQQQQQQSQQASMSAGKMNSWMVMREADLSVRLHAALAAVVPLQQYPKCAILINVTVLQDDGSILPACITAASLALADAAVEVYDLVTACSVAVVRVSSSDDDDDDQEPETIELWADPTLQEELNVHSTLSIMTMAILPNWKEVTIWEQSGSQPLSPELANRAMEICRDGCRTMHKFMRQHLIMQQQQPPPDQPGHDDGDDTK